MRIRSLKALSLFLFLTLSVRSALAASICDAVVGNLVQNCGFETGDFTDWQVRPAAFPGSFYGITSGSNSGFYAAYFGGTVVGDYDQISQTFSTVAGDDYSVSFYFFDNGDENDSDFKAEWDGNVIFDDLNGPDVGYEQLSFTEAGGGSDSLSFEAYDLPGSFRLDDVEVTDDGPATPEPSSALLLGAGLVALLTAARRSTSPGHTNTADGRHARW